MEKKPQIDWENVRREKKSEIRYEMHQKNNWKKVIQWVLPSLSSPKSEELQRTHV